MEQPRSRAEKPLETIFEELQRVHAMVADDLQGRSLPDAVEVLRKEREKRTKHFIDLFSSSIYSNER